MPRLEGLINDAETKIYTFAFPPEGFILESGEKLSPVTIAYETYGELNARGDNAILVLHALTGSAHVARHNSPDSPPGWWDPLVGKGRALDPTHYYLVCANILGSCYGSTGPASINPATGKPYAMSFPVISVRDMVRAQEKLLHFLGVKQLVTAVGGSLGGMQALEWAVTFPDYVRSVIPVATSARLSPQGIAYNEVQRQAIMLDPRWKGGNYYEGEEPEAGLALARMVGIITYKSDVSWNFKFGRAFSGRNLADYYRFDARFEIENYLHYQGQKLARRFDANSYLYLTKAMDLHDIGRGYPSYRAAFRRIKAKTLAVGISSDFLYPPYYQKEIVAILKSQGKEASYVELDSPYGHDAFLIEFEKLNVLLRDFLATVA